MSTRSADQIDLLGLPKKGAYFKVSKPLHEMPRLSGMLQVVEGDVNAEFRIIGKSLVDVSNSGGRAGRYWHISGDIEASLGLRCERCLETFNWPASVSIDVGVVFSDRDAELIPVAMEPHVLDGDELDAFSLVEDELILAIPSVPTHAALADCGDRVAALVNAEEGESETDSGNGSGTEPQTGRTNPFAVLAGLKGTLGGDKDENG